MPTRTDHGFRPMVQDPCYEYYQASLTCAWMRWVWVQPRAHTLARAAVTDPLRRGSHGPAFSPGDVRVQASTSATTRSLCVRKPSMLSKSARSGRCVAGGRGGGETAPPPPPPPTTLGCRCPPPAVSDQRCGVIQSRGDGPAVGLALQTPERQPPASRGGAAGHAPARAGRLQWTLQPR